MLQLRCHSNDVNNAAILINVSKNHKKIVIQFNYQLQFLLHKIKYKPSPFCSIYDYVCLEDILRVNQSICLLLLYFRSEYFSRAFWLSLTCIGTYQNALELGMAQHLIHLCMHGTHQHSLEITGNPGHPSYSLISMHFNLVLPCVSLALLNTPSLKLIGTQHVLACLSTQNILACLLYINIAWNFLACVGIVQNSLAFPNNH